MKGPPFLAWPTQPPVSSPRKATPYRGNEGSSWRTTGSGHLFGSALGCPHPGLDAAHRIQHFLLGTACSRVLIQVTWVLSLLGLVRHQGHCSSLSPPALFFWTGRSTALCFEHLACSSCTLQNPPWLCSLDHIYFFLRGCESNY